MYSLVNLRLLIIRRLNGVVEAFATAGMASKGGIVDV